MNLITDRGRKAQALIRWKNETRTGQKEFASALEAAKAWTGYDKSLERGDISWAEIHLPLEGGGIWRMEFTREESKFNFEITTQLLIEEDEARHD